MDKKLPTEPYKGVRDFYPEDMAIQSYIFNTWKKTVETFGFERYDASILEPADLYKSKGAVNAEMVNDQTYTFIDRGEREVTLRPEMTPTVARMVAGKHRELSFPLRWYSIPNLFRYERAQRGRLREHWQLNCDIFGIEHYTADVEIIALAHQLLIDFGATPDMFEIQLNNRAEMSQIFAGLGITEPEVINEITRLNDRKKKITTEEYETALLSIVGDTALVNQIQEKLNCQNDTNEVLEGLKTLGINNVKIDRTIARGFDYYTGTIFEIVDTDPSNNRSMLGGGRYDNLLKMFKDESVTGIGFGMGDVTMRDFLETHNLLGAHITKTAPTLVIIPTDSDRNLDSQKIAHLFRQREVKVSVDLSNKKIGKKISDAVNRGATFALIVGPDELNSGNFTLKNLAFETEESGTIDTLLTYLISHTT
ncbi:MAG: histidine--tRNA ligase [Candidatus Paceibacterota bacterium]